MKYPHEEMGARILGMVWQKLHHAVSYCTSMVPTTSQGKHPHTLARTVSTMLSSALGRKSVKEISSMGFPKFWES